MLDCWFNVAPRRGAWIEIDYGAGQAFSSAVAPRRGAWIEIDVFPYDEVIINGRTPQGCVDRNNCNQLNQQQTRTSHPAGVRG